ncbi:hypothetical protein PO909_002315 [Leuciscus waleckii]
MFNNEILFHCVFGEYIFCVTECLIGTGWGSDAKVCSATEKFEAKKRLFEHLKLDKKDPPNENMWPLIFNKDYATPANIYVDLYVTSITNVDEKAQSLTTQVNMITAWPNSNMMWNLDEFCQIDTFAAPKNMVWTPDIGIKESIKTEFGTRESPYVLLLSEGFTLSSDILSLTTACKLDLYRFPFDTQICSITFQSTVFSAEEIQLDVATDKIKILQQSKELFQAQGEWELIDINETKANMIDWVEADQLIYQITIKRRPVLYVINIMTPVFFFLVLDVISFFIDTSGSDKVSFKVTLLLSISVMLLILNDTLPSTSRRIPLIGVYCSVVFILIGISILETILVNYLMKKGAKKRSTVETAAAVTGK